MMNEATRDAIGRALYEASMDWTERTPRWESILNKEIWIYKAEAVIQAYRRTTAFEVVVLRDLNKE
jgi:hypothetical protein